MKRSLAPVAMVLLTTLALQSAGSAAHAATRLKSICRIKGQEENTLHGMGLVIGLKGTGDGGSSLPAIRMLAMAMQLMGNPVSGGAMELKNVKNVALVAVTATVPAAGARQGDHIDCVVSSIGSAKSLAGGRLFLTPLLGPQVESTRIYAFCQGSIAIEGESVPTTGRIHGGCQLEEDFFNPFEKDGKFTIVLDESHADFAIAQAVADEINHSTLVAGDRDAIVASEDAMLAHAIDRVNIEVAIPRAYQKHPVAFVAQILALEILLETEVRTAARVVINERTGDIIVGGDVEIGTVIVNHKNIVIQTGRNANTGRFVPVYEGDEVPPKLEALVSALNAINVPAKDMIDIIKDLKRIGKLHAKLIVH